MRRLVLSFFLLAMTILWPGCSRTLLRETIVTDGADWTMYGGGPGRQNVSHEVVNPPLDSVWEYNTGGGYGTSAAAAAGSVLLIANLRGEIHSVRTLTGERISVVDFGSAVMGTPSVDGNTIYVPLANNNEGILAYDMKAAKIVWRKKIGDIESSPLVRGERLYAATIGGRLFCLDKKTGEVIWIYSVPQDRSLKMIRSSPAGGGRTVVFGCDDGFLYGIDTETGKLLWNGRTGSSIFSSPSVLGGIVFVGSTDGIIYAFDEETGEQIWARSLSGKIHSSQGVDSGHLYVGTVSGSFFCLGADDGKIVWTTPLDGAINSSPIVSGSVVYVGTLSRTIYGLDAGSGKVLWQFKTGGRIKTSPVIAGCKLIVFKDDRTVTAFQESVKK